MFIRSEMDRLFDDLWSAPAQRAWVPHSEINEEKDHYLISLEIPGVPRDQIGLEMTGDQLSLSGTRRDETFYRAFTLPAGVDAEKVEADYQDGILRVYIPKAEAAKPRQIKITHGSATGFLGKLLGHGAKPASDGKAEKVA